MGHSSSSMSSSLSSTTKSGRSSSITKSLTQPTSPPPSTPANAGQTSESGSSSLISESLSQATSLPPTSFGSSFSSIPATSAPNPNSIAQTSVSSLASTPSPQHSTQSSAQGLTRKTRPLLVGGIVGIVLAAVALVAVLFWLWRRRRNRSLPTTSRARLDGDVLPPGPGTLDMTQNYDAGSAASLLRSRYLIDELHGAQEASDAVAEMVRRLAVTATSESPSLAPWSTSGLGPHRMGLMPLWRLRNETSFHTSTTGGDRVPTDSSMLEAAESSDGGSTFGGNPVDGLHDAQDKSAVAEIEGPVTANATPESLIPASRSISGSQRSESDLVLLRQRNEILAARIRQLEEQIRAPGTLGPPPDYSTWTVPAEH
ncbi:hypothetical protein C8R45DRAFT_500108 [Mycena sanguinolenta]|nr:hypothetical protein C8R45DRAFT_500108 [Mycena sanguinolenta]